MITVSNATSRAVTFSTDLLKQSRRTIVLTGAGISTPSGIPDFRSEGSGLWSRDEPLEVASLSTFRVAPARFYSWFRPLAGQIYHAQPNPAHLALAELEKQGRVHAVITQNIDLLHQKAGTKHVIELHGSIRTLTCVSCYNQVDSEAYIHPFVEEGRLPSCPRCGCVLKPDVILFGEQLPERAWNAAQKAVRECDLLLVAGSSLEVLPVAGLPMVAIDRGAHLIIVNNTPTYLNIRADVVILDDVAEVLPLMVEQMHYG